MPQDLSIKKSNFASAATVMAQRILTLARDCDEFAAVYFANSFNAGSVNALTQADLAGSNAYLTPAIIGNIVTAAQAVSTAIPSGARDTMRQAVSTPLP